MDKVQKIISELTPKERRQMLDALLIPCFKNLEGKGEACVLDENDKEVVGIIMTVERWEDLIDPETLDRLPVDRSKCRPKAEFMKELKAKLADKELVEKLEAQV